jgi:methionine-rich copper-binding protein CopC
MNRILTTLATVAIVTTLFAGVALAHAKYASSTPAPGQTLAASPASVAITFSEDLASDSTGAVTDAAGATVSTGATVSATDRTQMSIALKPSLPNGVYKVSWHSVASDDNGMLDGTFFFGVGVPAPSTATLPAAGSTGLALVLLALGTLLAAISTHALRSGRAPA